MSGSTHRQVLVGNGHDAAALAVDDRDRAAPVALARDEPVAQAVVDRGVALALAVEPRRRSRRAPRGCRRPSKSGWESTSVPSPRVGQALARVRAGSALGAAITRRIGSPKARANSWSRSSCAGHGHDRAGAVLHQHVVGDEHRDLLAVDGVGDGAAERHARLRLVGVAALLVGLVERVVDVVAHRLLVVGAGREAQHVGVLGRHHEERRPEQRVGPRREDRVVDAERPRSGT